MGHCVWFSVYATEYDGEKIKLFFNNYSGITGFCNIDIDKNKDRGLVRKQRHAICVTFFCNKITFGLRFESSDGTAVVLYRIRYFFINVLETSESAANIHLDPKIHSFIYIYWVKIHVDLINLIVHIFPP